MDVIVVPREYRGKILELSHEKSGHLGGEKVAKMVGRYFLWPGMVKEIEEHCQSCGACQRKSKSKPKKAPVVERPVLTEQFESVAVDLVGQLPKGKGGCLPTFVWLLGGLRPYHLEASRLRWLLKVCGMCFQGQQFRR